MPRHAEAFRLYHELQYVGRTIKSAKRRVTWKFAFEGEEDEHAVVLLHTINSGKKVIYLNGNQIFEEEKLSMATWQYPFQLESHLLTLIIEAQLSDEGMYELRVDGRPWADMRIRTIADMRAAKGRGKGREDDNVASGGWGRSGGRDGGEASFDGGEEDVPVPSKSLRDFIGESPSPRGSSHSHAAAATARTSKTAAAPAPAPASGAWDPFSDAPAPSPASAFDFGAPAPAPSHGHAHAAPHAHTRQAAAPAPAVSAASHALRPPPGGAHTHTRAVATHAAPAPAPAPAAPVSSLADDLAGLSFGAAPAPAVSMVHDPFAPAPAPVPATGGMPVLFGTPAPAKSAPRTAAPADPLYDGAKDLFDLDHLTAPKAGPATPAAAPSLAQLAASKPTASATPVMAGPAGMAFGMGASPLDMYAPAVPHTGMGFSPAMPAARGPMGYGHAMPAQGFPFGSPAPAPAPADYNPFA